METKKTYPSQINTKSIACRIPASDYVEFLQDAISKGININDWLLMKIYSSNKLGNLENIESREYLNLKDEIENKDIQYSELVEEYEILEEKYKEIEEKCNYFEQKANYYSIASVENIKNQLVVILTNKLNEKTISVSDCREIKKEFWDLLRDIE